MSHCGEADIRFPSDTNENCYLSIGTAAGTAAGKSPEVPLAFLEPARRYDLSATQRQMVGDAIVANGAWCPLRDKCPNSFL